MATGHDISRNEPAKLDGRSATATNDTTDQRVAPNTPVRAPVRGITRAELADLLRDGQADPALRDDLAELAGETTDDLGPIA